MIAALNSIPQEAWWMGGGFIAINSAIELFPRLRHAWYARQLQRLMARPGGIMREQHRDLSLAMGGDIPPLQWGRFLGQTTLISALLVVYSIAMDRGLGDEFTLACFAVGALGYAYKAWRKINDPPSGPGDAAQAVPTILPVPREAILAGLAGLVLMGAVVLYAVIRAN